MSTFIQTQLLEPPCTAFTSPRKVLLNNLSFEDQHLRISATDAKVKTILLEMKALICSVMNTEGMILDVHFKCTTSLNGATSEKC